MNKVKMLSENDMKKFLERCYEKYEVPFYFVGLDTFEVFFHPQADGKCCVGDIMTNDLIRCYHSPNTEDKLILRIADKGFAKEERMIMQNEMNRLLDLIYDYGV